MKTIAIPQFYCGPSGQKGLYNRQEVGLARAFAALGCRAVVLYPAPGAAAPTVENPEPNVKIYYLPVQKLGPQAFFSSWQVLLDEQVDAVHVMGDNSPGVPSLYRFCRKHGILFYSQLGALKSTSGRTAVRAVMDLLLRRHFIVRTAWLYSYYGKNFVKTMVRLGKTHDEITVVNDQLGNPTNAVDLAYHILKLAVSHDYGIYHCTGNGICSWYDFASAIMKEAGLPCKVNPCTSAEYAAANPASASRPAWSALENRMLRCTVGDEMRDWQDALHDFFANWNGEL